MLTKKEVATLLEQLALCRYVFPEIDCSLVPLHSVKTALQQYTEKDPVEEEPTATRALKELNKFAADLKKPEWKFDWQSFNEGIHILNQLASKEGPTLDDVQRQLVQAEARLRGVDFPGPSGNEVYQALDKIRAAMEYLREIMEGDSAN